jgi:hypothetical protein
MKQAHFMTPVEHQHLASAPALRARRDNGKGDAGCDPRLKKEGAQPCARDWMYELKEKNT